MEESEPDVGEGPEGTAVEGGPDVPIHHSDGMIGPDSTTPAEAVDVLPFDGEKDAGSEPVERIGPASTGPADTAEIVPERPPVERIGPDGTSPEEAMDVLESIFSSQLPEETEAWAAFYRTNFRERMHMDVDVYDGDDGGAVIIQKGDD